MSERLFETPSGAHVQGRLDDLGQPLHDVTFCVVDLETTGGSVHDCSITEVGAVKVNGGECLGTYQTFVDPGCAIPPEITVLTGITQAMVMRAPAIDAVLPSLLEFIGDAVIVGHNIRFDISFLDAALRRGGWDRLPNPTVDTLSLARRLLRDEVPNCRLGTLADRLRLDHRPSHRALDDALATADLLHVLLERAGSLGVTGLDDLRALPTMAGNAQAAKLRLTEDLPRGPGVYVFRGRTGSVLYVGKAANLRSRVRSYFSTDQRRKIAQLLRETARIDHRVCRNGLEAAVLELRLIHRHRPRFNHQFTRSHRYPYVKLTLNERLPRLSVVNDAKDDGGLYLGPLSSTKQAKRVIEAIETAVPVRRCTKRPRRGADIPVCAPGQLGVACCPCSGATAEADYRAVVGRVVAGLTRSPDLLLAPLRARLVDLASEERFEEAADVRDRAESLAGALRRSRRFDLLRRAGRIRIRVADAWAEIDDGRLTATGRVGETIALPGVDDLDTRLAYTAATERPVELAPVPGPEPLLPLTSPGPLPVPSRRDADELLCIGRWLDDHADLVRLEVVDGVLAEPFPAVPSFAAKGASPARRTEARTGVTPERSSRSRSARPRRSRAAS